MKAIIDLVDQIEDELKGAKKYIKLAFRNKTEHPNLADRYAELAEAEMGHVKALHEEAASMIDEVRRRDGEPPADMMAVYNYEHKKQMDCAAKIRQMIAEYRNE